MKILGAQIRAARLERRMTVAELAERVGVSAKTMSNVERGDPKTAVGTVFEAAIIVGIPLFAEGAAESDRALATIEGRLRLLPQRARPAPEVDDDF